MKQSFFDFTGPQLAEIGGKMALDHANELHPNWGDEAYKLICDYVKAYGSIPFRAEEVRSYAAQIDFPLPPSARSWGYLFTKAAREGIIKSVGYTQVLNKKAHAANCRLWVRN